MTENKVIKQLPPIEEVIQKIKNLEELNAAEELVYLLFIEELPEDKARQIIKTTYEDSDL